jgi:hypothetical protein
MPKQLYSRREKDFILEAAELEHGETLVIPVNTKKEQQRTFTALNNLARDYTAMVERDIALIVTKPFKDKRLWVAIKKEVRPKERYILGSDGQTVRRKEDEDGNS